MGNALDGEDGRLLQEVTETNPEWVVAAKIIGLVTLNFMACFFSGLNLGLMCLEPRQLQMLVTAAEKPGADRQAVQHGAWAKRILPLRKDGNMLLCTILFANTAATSYLAILMDEFFVGPVAVVFSTLLIVSFGEILPQALCYKHSLRIGAMAVPFMTLTCIVLYPVTKPLGMLLDWCLGEEVGQVLDREQLLALIEYQRKQAPHLLTEEEAKILRGSLDFSKLTAKNIMVPLSECFCLDANAVVNRGLRTAVAEAGYSRIPVIDRDPTQPKKPFIVVGLIHAKDLLLTDTDNEIPLKALLSLIVRELFVVDHDRPLPELLEEFRQGASQLAVVRGLEGDEDGAEPTYRHVGILTLQGLLNTIVQDDVKEVDAADSDVTSIASTAPEHMYSNARRFSDILQTEALKKDVLECSPRISVFLRTVHPVLPLSMDEVVAAAAFLRRRHVDLFGAVCPDVLEDFVAQDCRVAPSHNDGHSHQQSGGWIVYRRGEESNYAVLVLSGEVKVLSGNEGFESLHGPWSLLGKRCLETPQGHAGRAGSKALFASSSLDLDHPQRSLSAPAVLEQFVQSYVPDFTALAASDKEGNHDATRLLMIPAEAYSRLVTNWTIRV